MDYTNIKKTLSKNIINLTNTILFLNEQGYEINKQKWNKLTYNHILAHSVNSNMFSKYKELNKAINVIL